MFITFTWKTSFYSDSLRYDYNHIAKMLYNDTSFFSKFSRKLWRIIWDFECSYRFSFPFNDKFMWIFEIEIHFIFRRKKKFKIRSFIMMSMMEKKIHLFWTFFSREVCVYTRRSLLWFFFERKRKWLKSYYSNNRV